MMPQPWKSWLEHVRAYYVKLLQEPGTVDGVELAVSQSGLKKTRGQERRSVFMTMLSADSLGESAGRAPHRRAPADRGELSTAPSGVVEAAASTPPRRRAP